MSMLFLYHPELKKNDLGSAKKTTEINSIDFKKIHLWCIFIVIVTLHSANVKLLIWSIKHSTLAKLDNSNSTTFDLTPRIMQRVHLRDKCIISNANQIIFNTHTAPFPRTPTHPHCHTHEWSNYVPVCCALSEITHLSNLIRV